MSLFKLCVVLTAILCAAAQLFSQISEYYGMCDASAALPVDNEHFIMASDEDNVLRVYHIDKKYPVSSLDISSFLKIEYDDKSAEADFEDAEKLGDYYFFITSHGRDRKGRLRRNRHQFFAVKVDPNTFEIMPVGKSFQKLMDYLVLNDELKQLGVYETYLPSVKKDENLAPKERGVNIEGLAATPDGKSFLIGFRNPTPNKMAIVVELLNPLAVVLNSELPKFGRTFLLNMKNRGVRSFEYYKKIEKYLVVGGAHDGKKNSRLYIWNGSPAARPVLIKDVDFGIAKDLNPEAISIYDGIDQIQLYSDDGAVLRSDGAGGECACKDIESPALKMFRAMWIDTAVLELGN